MHALTKKPIRLVIVEGEGLYRDLLRVSLGRLRGLEVVGAFENGPSALRAATGLRPDVAVLDLELADSNGIQVALKLRQLLPDLGVVLLTSQRDLGVLASIPDSRISRWSYLINKSSHNLTTLGRAVQVTAARLLNLHEADDPTPLPPTAASRLSSRQWEILGLVAHGMSNAAVAEVLELKVKTIENQLAVIYEKLDVERERSVGHPRVKAVLRYLSALDEGGPPEDASS